MSYTLDGIENLIQLFDGNFIFADAKILFCIALSLQQQTNFTV